MWMKTDGSKGEKCKPAFPFSAETTSEVVSPFDPQLQRAARRNQGESFIRHERRFFQSREPEVLSESAENHGALEPDEVTADARARAAAEREVRELRQLVP